MIIRRLRYTRKPFVYRDTDTMLPWSIRCWGTFGSRAKEISTLDVVESHAEAVWYADAFARRGYSPSAEDPWVSEFPRSLE